MALSSQQEIPNDPISNRFKAQRTQVGQRAEAGRQQNQDALMRRFSSMGALNSGAAIKAQQLSDETATRQKEQALSDVDAQEGSVRLAQEEAKSQRDFQSGEAEKMRGFQSGETEKQRGFQASQAGIDRAFQDKVFQFDKESKLKQLDLQAQSLTQQSDESEFNKRLARYQAGQSGGLFGSGGFAGLGFGGGPADI